MYINPGVGDGSQRSLEKKSSRPAVPPKDKPKPMKPSLSRDSKTGASFQELGDLSDVDEAPVTERNFLY